MTAAASTTDAAAPANHAVGLVRLSFYAVIIGLVTGIGAVVFRALIGFIHNLFFLGQFSFAYDANHFTPAGAWGAWIILAPVIGGVVVTALVENFAPDARGHGVPEVMDAIYYKEGVIPPQVAAIKSLASAFSIGSGAAVGREGPIIQIGASLGSTLGQVLKLAPWQRITMVAAGAGAGIAATFNTPIGGVLFAIELMLPEVSVRTFLPVALSTGTATFVGNWLIGPSPAFAMPPAPIGPAHAVSIFALCLYALLGAVMGLAATAFVRGLTFAEDAFEKIESAYLRHAIGMLLLGILIYTLFHYEGHYFVEGVGYATIQAILLSQFSPLWLLPLLFVAKLAATSTSLGSGASGGIFSPSLFMGASLGGAFGLAVNLVHPLADANLSNFAIVGMAAMVGGGTGAAMTAVTMIFEMTRDYSLVMPMIVAVAVSLGVRRMLSRENIYTVKLVGRRHLIPKALHANMFLVRHANEIMDKDVLVLPAETAFDAFLRWPEHGGALKHVVVTKDDRIEGVLRVNTALRRGLEDTYTGVTLGDIAQHDFVIAHEDDIGFDIIERMWHRSGTMAVVVAGKGAATAKDVRGIISKEHVADSVAENITRYA
jgi:CIC family chloride channel protein